MIHDYIKEYFLTLINTMDVPMSAFENLVTTVASVLVYIPIHLIIKWLLGEKNARLSLIAYLATVVISITGAFVGA